MKNMSVLLFILFFIEAAISQGLPCKIMFPDGDTYEGFSEITKKDKILFRLDKKSIPDEYGPNDISQVEFYGQKENRVFEYVKVLVTSKKSKYRLMEVIENGKIILYQHYKKKRFNESSGKWNFNEKLPSSNGKWEDVNIVTRYLKVRNNEFLISLNEPDDVKNILTKYMSDCSTVLNELQLIDDVYDIADLVWQYNRDCGENEK